MLSAPELCEVDFPSVLVREASYPGDGTLLRVVLASGHAGAERQTIAFRGLDLSRHVRLVVDGTEIVLGADKHEAASGDLEAKVHPADGLLRLTLIVNRDRRIEIH
jgi:hypothetical protein